MRGHFSRSTGEMTPADTSFSAFDLVPAIFKLIRKARGTSTKAIGMRFGQSWRNYQFIEAGRHGASLAQIKCFAEATDSDPYAILIAQFIRSPRFALRTADNKLATILLMVLEEFDADYGDAVAELDAGVLTTELSRAFQELGRLAQLRQSQRLGLLTQPEHPCTSQFPSPEDETDPSPGS